VNFHYYDLIGLWMQLGIFIGLLILLPVLEHFFARRHQSGSIKRRFGNIGLILTSTISAQLIFPLATVAVALWADIKGFGLFQFVQWLGNLEIILCLVLMDLGIYWQHRFFHIFPWLWRMHRVHHSDTEFDASLGVRFHPFEIILSKAYKLGLIALLGPAVSAVLLYECLLLAFSLMTHGNIRLPLKLDALLRFVFVTPDFHRVHHSVYQNETNSNYGNILSLWDKLFGSYLAQPRDGHEAMRIGLETFRNTSEQTFIALLAQPFRNITTIADKTHA
jgi:sterol desaturase/sphingolipid hydroxylase (fatty acid hydroxylase superfamily)